MHKTLLSISREGGGKCPLLPMPASAHALDQYQILGLLLGDRGTRVRTTCPRLLRIRTRPHH